ncbi:MAG: sulfotransferase [Lysobacterales bacterium]
MDTALRQGLRLIEAGQYEKAHQGAIGMIHADTTNPAPYFLLAHIALEHGNYSKAGELFTRARDLAPAEPLYVAGLGQYLVTVGRSEEALACADTAARTHGQSAHVADTIGVIYSRAGFHEKAVPFFTEAVALDSRPANYHYNLGASLQFSGQFAEAEKAYRKTIERQPDNYRAYSSLVGLSKQSDTHHLLNTLEPLYEQTRSDPDAALHLGHAIAKTLEDLGQYPASFDWLQRAKRRKRAALSYAVDSDLVLFQAAAATARAPDNDDSANAIHDASPIFIIGLPRTGTTLVDRIVSSHPDVVSAGELNTFADLIKSVSVTRSAMVLDEPTLSAARDTRASQLTDVGRRYMERTANLARGGARFTDKMPLNFFYAGLILRALPNAKIVCLRRGAIDSCLSNFRQLFSTGFSYYNYSLDILDTARYYQGFDQLMGHWQTQLPSQNFLQIHYEDIVLDQENQTRRLLEFCGLPWFDGCLNFHENPSPVSTASSVQVRQPLYSGAINRWKKYGEALRPLREALGNPGVQSLGSDSSGT